MWAITRITWQYLTIFAKSFSNSFLPFSSFHFLEYLVNAFFLDLYLIGFFLFRLIKIRVIYSAYFFYGIAAFASFSFKYDNEDLHHLLQERAAVNSRFKVLHHESYQFNLRKVMSQTRNKIEQESDHSNTLVKIKTFSTQERKIFLV